MKMLTQSHVFEKVYVTSGQGWRSMAKGSGCLTKPRISKLRATHLSCSRSPDGSLQKASDVPSAKGRHVAFVAQMCGTTTGRLRHSRQSQLVQAGVLAEKLLESASPAGLSHNATAPSIRSPFVRRMDNHRTIPIYARPA